MLLRRLRRGAPSLAALVTSLAACAGGGGTPQPVTGEPATMPSEGATASSEAEEPAPAPATAPPTEPAAPAARLEVRPPAGLVEALTARRPTIEIVPQSCGVSPEAVVITDERVCVQDTASGLTRAMRRFATAGLHAISAARTGDDVVFGVVTDDEGAITRYAGRIWRWGLRDDVYAGLVGPSGGYSRPSVVATDFGVLVIDHDREMHWVFADGALERVRPFDPQVDDLVVVEGRSYVRDTAGARETLFSVRRDGPRIVFDRVASYPVAGHLPLLVAFPEGRPLVISAFPRGATTRLHIVTPPSREVRQLDVAVDRPRGARFVDGALELRTRDGRVLVDLATGAITPSTTPPPEEPSHPRIPRPSSLHSMSPTPGGLVLGTAGGVFALDAEGVHRLEEAPATAVRNACRCRDEALVCGDAAPIVGACTRVEDLERLSALDADYEEREDQPATSYAPDGRFRVDRLEPDLARVTRLADGARLWARIADGAVLAQADDGAFWLPEDASVEGYALRWGRSLLDAPVTALARHREAFFRPSLVADFFAGRPLPAADTTLPSEAP